MAIALVPLCSWWGLCRLCRIWHSCCLQFPLHSVSVVGCASVPHTANLSVSEGCRLQCRCRTQRGWALCIHLEKNCRESHWAICAGIWNPQQMRCLFRMLLGRRQWHWCRYGPKCQTVCPLFQACASCFLPQWQPLQVRFLRAWGTWHLFLFLWQIHRSALPRHFLHLHRARQWRWSFLKMPEKP